MLEDIVEMRRRHKQEVEQLQKLCTHKDTRRSRYAWAPGHFGNDVEICKHCGKVVKQYDSFTPLDASFD